MKVETTERLRGWKRKLEHYDDQSLEPILLAGVILIGLAATLSLIGAIRSDRVLTEIEIDGRADPGVGFSVGADGIAWGSGDREDAGRAASAAVLAGLADLEFDSEPSFPDDAEIRAATVLVEMIIEGQLGFGPVDADLDVGAFFLAIVATGFLARIWKRGVSLQADANLTI